MKYYKSFCVDAKRSILRMCHILSCHITYIRLGRRNPAVNEQQLEKFRAAVVEVLRRRYRDHWFPEKPFKGSGYRCIRINGKMDPVIAQAAETCGLAANLIHSVSKGE